MQEVAVSESSVVEAAAVGVTDQWGVDVEYIDVPAGPLGVTFSKSLAITTKPGSILDGKIRGGMRLIAVDDIDVSSLSSAGLVQLLVSRADRPRRLAFRLDAKKAVAVSTVCVEGAIKVVNAQPGRLGLCFKTVERHELKPCNGTRSATVCMELANGAEVGTFTATMVGMYCWAGADSPLAGAMELYKPYRLLSINGQAPPPLANETVKLLTSKADALERKIVLIAVGAEQQVPGTILEKTPSGTLKVTALSPISPLLPFAAIGAEILEVNGSKDKLNNLLDCTIEQTVLVLKISSRPVAKTRMEFIPFIPLDFSNGAVNLLSNIDFLQSRGFFDDDFMGATNLSGGRYETLSQMKVRMNYFLIQSGLKVTSIETASIDGSIARANAGRYRSGGGDKSEWVYNTLRVWYNALDPDNMTCEMLAAIEKQKVVAESTTKQALGGCCIQ